MIHERIIMSAPPFGSASPSFGPKALKAQKPKMLILLAICIHDKALCIQLANVQISFTELKSSLKIPSLTLGLSESSMTKSKSKSPRFARAVRVFNDKRSPSGHISRVPLADARVVRDSNDKNL